MSIMRFFLFIILLITSKLFAQQDAYCKQVNDIVLMEKINHERLNSSSKSVQAFENFDVKYYRLQLEVDPAVRYIKGEVTVYFSLLSQTHTISFDLMNDLVVDSVKQQNSLLINQHTDNILQVSFATDLSVSSLDSISIFYHGIPASTGFGSFIQSNHSGVPVIWTLSEPYGSRDWWPCKNGLDDKADSIDVYITNPMQYTAASNGLLQSEVINGVNKVTHWKHRYPIASYLVCFAVTNYSVLNNSVQLGNITLPMQTYCYPESIDLFRTNTPFVLDALQLYYNLFHEYPFIKEKYGHVQFGWGGGMEHQTSTFIVTPNESLMAHELGHQWFGDKITCASWQDIWLNEGFATHLASIYMENKYPASALVNRKNEIASITSFPDGSVFVDDTTNVNRIFNGRLSYTKGSHLLYMLRWKLGDSVFFKGLRQYLKDTAVVYGYARTQDLKRNLEQVSGTDLTEFFKDWFYGQGYPSYNIKWSQLGSNYVSIKISQATSHSSVNFFAMPVALQFKNASQQKTIVVDNKTNNEVFYRNIGFVADTVIIDPEYWLISKDNTSEKITDTITGQNLIQIFPNPVQNQLYVYVRNLNFPDAAITLYNAMGQLIFRKQVSVYNGSAFEEIPLYNLSSGVYFIKLQSGNSLKFVKKIVKQ